MFTILGLATLLFAPRMGPSDFQTYQYAPLRHPRSIRLLRLKHSSGSSLRWEIIEASVDNSPDYEALSYVWGSSTLEETILCNGKPLKVTSNCAEALRNLQPPPGGERLVWVDFICINQSSIHERNQQVALMAQIYGKAK